MKRGGGKTPLIIGGDFEQGMAKLWLAKGMSTLIIDDFPHPKYAHIPILHPKDYHKLTTHPGIYRTLCPVHHMPALLEKLNDVYNTLIVFEDCYKYFPNKFGDAETALMGNSKQKNVDLLFMHWCWGWVPPDLLRVTNFFIIGDTSDGPECREQYLRGCYNLCVQAHRIVKAKKKPYQVVDSGI